MLQYYDEISDFIEQNFEPAEPEKANFKQDTRGMLNWLFALFPKDCISDYDLNKMLIELDYKRHVFIMDITIEKENDKGTKFYEIHKQLVTGWCFKSPLDLRTEDIKGLTDDDILKL